MFGLKTSHFSQFLNQKWRQNRFVSIKKVGKRQVLCALLPLATTRCMRLITPEPKPDQHTLSIFKN
jgi:hypothetical protein